MIGKPKVARAKSSRWVSAANKFVAVLVVFAVGTAYGQGRFDHFLPHRHNVGTTLPKELNYSSVDEVYQALKDNYDGTLTADQLTDGLKHGLATATKDPYTVYFTAKEANDFTNMLNQTFSGIGAELGQDKDGYIIIATPIAGQPAEKAGLKSQDIITKIDGKSATGISIEEAVTKIRGKEGTKVALEVVRDHKTTLNFTITRGNITIPSVTTKMLDGNIGYIQISSFANDTVSLAVKAAQDFKSKNVKGIVLDLRNDGGGLLDAAVRVSSLWLAPGTNIMTEKQGSTVKQNYAALGGDDLHGIPTVILVNSGSASASEITTGALRDNKAAYVIGEKTYGKGVVQQLINFRDGSQLKVTVASWYRPNGQSINHQGITPDKTVKISDEDLKAKNDTQLQAAQAYLNQ